MFPADYRLLHERLQKGGMIIFTVPGRPVPYVRTQGKALWKQPDRAKKYFEYCHHVWKSFQDTSRRYPEEHSSLSRIESGNIYFFLDFYVYGGVRGDTDNYGKAIKDALQDRRTVKNEITGPRLYKNDKFGVFDMFRLIEVKKKEEERVEGTIYYDIIKPEVDVTGNSFKLIIDMPYKFETLGFSKELITCLYDSLQKRYGYVFTFNPPDAKELILHMKKVNLKIFDDVILHTLHVGRTVILPMVIEKTEEVFNDYDTSRIEITFLWEGKRSRKKVNSESVEPE